MKLRSIYSNDLHKFSPNLKIQALIYSSIFTFMLNKIS